MRLNKLKGRIVEEELTIPLLAKKLNISPGTLRNKLKGKTMFNRNEIQRISEILQLTKDEMFNLFFD